MLNTLTDLERSVFFEAARSGGDFKAVAEAHDHTVKEVTQIFERAQGVVVRYRFGEPNSSWPTQIEIARKLNVSAVTAQRRLHPHRFTGIRCKPPGKRCGVRFPPEIAEGIYQTHAVLLSYPPKGNTLSLNEICVRCKIEYSLALRLITFLGILGIKTRDGDNRLYTTYPSSTPETLDRFRLPDHGGWLTANGIAGILDVDPATVRKRLKTMRENPACGLEWEVRASRLNRKPAIHYPPSTVELVRDLKDRGYPPAGDWITAHRIEALTGISNSTIVRSLKRGGIRSERRVNANNRVLVHYPPEAEEAAKRLHRPKSRTTA
jgi:hypothetical protein